MEMDFLDVGIVNFGFRRSQGLKDLYRPIFRRLADARCLNDLSDFFQPAMRVGMSWMMFVFVRMAVFVRLAVLIRMAV